jgi:lipopolysaccharide transport protein LptA
MNKRCSALIIFALSMLAFATYPALVRSETSLKSLLGGGTSGPITILGPAEIENDKEKNIIIVVWPDKVHATNADMVLDCDRLEIYYKNPPKSDKAEKSQPEIGNFDKIERVMITGNVKITRTDGSSATAEKVVYNKPDENVIMTGNPVSIKQGNNLFEGSKITYDLKKEKYFIEDSSSSKAVIYPNELKGKSIVP